MRLPSAESLRGELLAGNTPPGTYDPSVVQFGCEGCEFGHRFVTRWLSIAQLLAMMNSEQDIPRGFVLGNYSSIGKAKACANDENTKEPICEHSEALKTVISRTQPFPEI